MTAQFFLQPTLGDGLSYKNAFRPKYPLPQGSNGGIQYFNPEQACMVAGDISFETQQALIAHPDVVPYPVDLDVELGLVVPTEDFKARHEALFVAADWMVDGMSLRVCNRRVLGVMAIGQKMFSLGNPGYRMLQLGYDARIEQLPELSLQAFFSALVGCGIELTGSQVVLTSTIREALALIVHQFDGRQRVFGSVSN